MGRFKCIDIGRIDLIDTIPARCDLRTDGLADLQHRMNIINVRYILDLARAVQHHGSGKYSQYGILTAADIYITVQFLSPNDPITSHLLSSPLNPVCLALLGPVLCFFPEPDPSSDEEGSVWQAAPEYMKQASAQDLSGHPE